MGDKLDFLLADKHKSFLQDDGITLSGCSQACPKYPKQQVYNIFSINMSRKTWRIKLLKWHYYFRCVWPSMSILPKVTSLLFLSNILRKKWVIQLFLCMQISMKACFNLIPWFWWRWSSIHKVPKIASLQCLYNVSKKKLEMKLTFCMQINIKVSYKLISTLWASNVSTRWNYQYWWAWSSILKVLKVTSLQYLYNIWKKNLGIGFIFCMQINIKTSTS